MVSRFTKRGNLCVVTEDPNNKPPADIVGQCTIENLERKLASMLSVLGIIVQKHYRNSV